MYNPWRTLASQYLGIRKARQSLARLSRAHYAGVLADYADYMLDVPVDAAPETIVAGVDRWMADKGWSASTCCTNLGIVRPFLEWSSLHMGVVHGVEAAAMLHNPRKPRAIPRALSTDAIRALLEVVPDARGRVIVLLESQCGLRRAEVAGLHLSHVDLRLSTIRVWGKGQVERVVYPSGETVEAIEKWLIERGTRPGYLICRFGNPAAGLTPTYVGILVSQWMTDAGLKRAPGDGVSGHALRHSTATNLLRSGANIRVVQEAMGHASMVTTARYLRADDTEVRAAMTRLTYR